MEDNNKLSLSDSDKLREDEKLLKLLLKDQTTGEYFLNREISGFGKVDVRLQVKDGVLTVLKGSRCCT